MKMCSRCKLPKSPRGSFYYIGENYWHDRCWETHVKELRKQKRIDLKNKCIDAWLTALNTPLGYLAEKFDEYELDKDDRRYLISGHLKVPGGVQCIAEVLIGDFDTPEDAGKVASEIFNLLREAKGLK